jgi:DNA polymerase I-like protein with 3'-5' exonuclease and polymerase domains
MQNISANVEDSANRETLELFAKWLKEAVGTDFIGLRDYLLPDEGMLICCTDYNQQELRLFAHFEDGNLAEQYRKQADLDVHTYIQKTIKDMLNIEYPRKHVKVTVFGILYGMGLVKLAARLGIDKKTAQKLRNAIYAAIPGIKQLQRDLGRLARLEEPLVTWGGRRYMCEEPRYNAQKDEWMTFEYKQLNSLIQASSADYTKQGMLNVRDAIPEIRIAVQVHDELVTMVPHRRYAKMVEEAMCASKLRIPMVANSKLSDRSWGSAK